MKTLADHIVSDLDILSIGLNPSLSAVQAGYYFATPQNRFWRALNASGLLAAPVAPSPEAHALLLARDRIGFTDLVKRPTRGGAQLRAADFRQWAPCLRERVIESGAYIAWFHGLQAYRAYLRYGMSESERGELAGQPSALAWGRQAQRIGASVVFVTPNPSPANAAYSLDAITQWFRRLARERKRLAVRRA